MPGTRRLDLGGVAQHVVQRGNDRQACFFSPPDYQRYLGDLREAALKQACQIHAYVVMTNHVHLLSRHFYLQRQRALGTDKFRSRIEHQLQRRAGLGTPGRRHKEKVL